MLLYVGASARKFTLQQVIRNEDGSWELIDAPKELEPNQVTVLVVQGLDFFAEIPALEDQMPPARNVSDAAVVLVGHDVQRITSTAIRWLERYSQSLEENGGVFILADVNPPVMDTLRRTGALDIIGAENVIPATTKLLEAEYLAWEAAQKWIEGHIVSARPVGETPEQS